MTWKDGNISVSHPREPWDDALPSVIVQCANLELTGKPDTVERQQYAAAKFQFSLAAAKTIIAPLMTKDAKDLLVAHTIAGGGIGARIVVPHPAFDDVSGDFAVMQTNIPRNALPFAYAAYLRRTLGLESDVEIVEVARPGRTKLPLWSRFLYQPSFGGAVRPGQPYVLVDDVVTTGGTLAALRSYIVRNGGKVVFATAIAHKSGRHQQFSILKQTINQLQAHYGENLNQVWTETIGHGIDCLTEAEGKFLSEWADEMRDKGCKAGPELLQRLRDRLNEAAAKNGA